MALVEIPPGTCENLDTGLPWDSKVENGPPRNVGSPECRSPRVSKDHQQWFLGRRGEITMHGQAGDVGSEGGFDPKPLSEFESEQDRPGQEAEDDQQS